MYSYNDQPSSTGARYNDSQGVGRDSRDTNPYTTRPVYQAPYSEPHQHEYSRINRSGGDVVVSVGDHKIHHPFDTAQGVYPSSILQPMPGNGEPLPPTIYSSQPQVYTTQAPNCYSSSAPYGRGGEASSNPRGRGGRSGGNVLPPLQQQFGIISAPTHTPSYSVSSHNSYQARQNAPLPQQYPYQQSDARAPVPHQDYQRPNSVQHIIQQNPESGAPSSPRPLSCRPPIRAESDQDHDIAVGVPNRSGHRDGYSNPSFSLTNRALYLEIVGEEGMTDFAYGTTVKELEGVQFVVDHVKREAHEASRVPHLIWNEKLRTSNNKPEYPDLRDTVKKLEMKLDNARKAGEDRERQVLKLTRDIEMHRKIIKDGRSNAAKVDKGTVTEITSIRSNESICAVKPSDINISLRKQGGPSTYSGRLISHPSGTTRASQIRPTSFRHMCGLIAQILRLPSYKSVTESPLTATQLMEFEAIAPSTYKVYTDFMNTENQLNFNFSSYEHLYIIKETASSSHKFVVPATKRSRNDVSESSNSSTSSSDSNVPSPNLPSTPLMQDYGMIQARDTDMENSKYNVGGGPIGMIASKTALSVHPNITGSQSKGIVEVSTATCVGDGSPDTTPAVNDRNGQQSTEIDDDDGGMRRARSSTILKKEGTGKYEDDDDDNVTSQNGKHFLREQGLSCSGTYGVIENSESRAPTTRRSIHTVPRCVSPLVASEITFRDPQWAASYNSSSPPPALTSAAQDPVDGRSTSRPIRETGDPFVPVGGTVRSGASLGWVNGVTERSVRSISSALRTNSVQFVDIMRDPSDSPSLSDARIDTLSQSRNVAIRGNTVARSAHVPESANRELRDDIGNFRTPTGVVQGTTGRSSNISSVLCNLNNASPVPERSHGALLANVDDRSIARPARVHEDEDEITNNNKQINETNNILQDGFVVDVSSGETKDIIEDRVNHRDHMIVNIDSDECAQDYLPLPDQQCSETDKSAPDNVRVNKSAVKVSVPAGEWPSSVYAYCRATSVYLPLNSLKLSKYLNSPDYTESISQIPNNSNVRGGPIKVRRARLLASGYLHLPDYFDHTSAATEEVQRTVSASGNAFFNYFDLASTNCAKCGKELTVQKASSHRVSCPRSCLI